MEITATGRIRTLRHRGKEVLTVDASHCRREQLEIVLKDYFTFLSGLAPKRDVLVLMDYSGSQHDPNLATLWKSELPLLNARLRRSAVIGMSALNTVAAQAYRQSAELMGQSIGEERGVQFNDRTEALDWLTS